MKTKKITLFAMAIALISCGQQNSIRNNDNVSKSKIVKYCQEIKYNAFEKFGEIEQGEDILEYHFYRNNQLGQTVFNIDYSLNFNSITISSYDKDGLISTIIDNETFERRYFYGNNKVDIFSYKKNGDVEVKISMELDNNGNPIVLDRTWDDERFYRTFAFKYKNTFENVETSTNYFNSIVQDNFPMRMILEIKKPVMGRIIREDQYNFDGTLKSTTKYEYDSDDQLIKVSIYNGNNQVLNSIQEYTYNENGDVITSLNQSLYINNNPLFKMLKVYAYKYNSENKWIEKTTITGSTTLKGEPDNTEYTITKRKIVYYGDSDEKHYPEWDSNEFKGILLKNKK